MSIGENLTSARQLPPAAMPLQGWLWRSYARSAIIPLLAIELTFLAIYWISNSIVYHDNVAAVSTLSRQFLQDVARRQANSISSGIAGISRNTDLLARQTVTALDGDFDPPASEKQRYAAGAHGGLHTISDNGTTASFYSSITPIGPEQRAKVWKLAMLDPLMMDLRRSDPRIASVYVNTADSYNRIYPYFDVASQYPPDMNIPTYNFYYEADGRHDPARKPVWTDAYVDPAGKGWMVSSIAPVWRGDRLEGVVGIDITLDTIIDQLMKIELPWDGYAILVDREGRIIAMPPAGEQDFGLKELTDHRYSSTIRADTFKPESFNINRRADTRQLAAAMRRADSGEAIIQFDGPHTATFSTIAGPGWHLVVIAPNSRILASANTLRDRLQAVGLIMLAGLLFFYLVFFALLFRRARAMTERVAAPLGEISQLVERIGRGDYRQEFAGSQVAELDDLGRRLVHTGEQLGNAHDEITRQERIASRALARQKQTNEELVRFVRIMSHELRTPLAVIDSGAQILDRKADSLTSDDLRDRAGRVRNAVRRISDLLHKLVESLDPHADSRQAAASVPVDLATLISELASDMVPRERLRLELPPDHPQVTESPAWTIAIRAALDNAMRYSPENSPIRVTLDSGGQNATVTIADAGPGIPASEQPHLGERFFRGSAATGTEGTGVGLYVARKLVDGLGGRIEFAASSKGTRVIFTLPLVGVAVPA